MAKQKPKKKIKVEDILVKILACDKLCKAYPYRCLDCVSEDKKTGKITNNF